MFRTGPEEGLVDSDASAQITGIKSFQNIFFKVEHGWVTFEGMFHVTRTRTGSEYRLGSSTRLKESYNGDAEDNVISENRDT